MQMIPVLFGVTFSAFLLINVLPGDVVASILGDNYSPASAAILTKQLHLDQPLLERYFTWVGSAVKGNLGTSLIQHASVGDMILHALGPTFELVLVAQVISIVVAVIFAVASVASPWAWVDRVATTIALAGNSIPAFVTGLLILDVFAGHLHWLPAFGWIPPSEGLGENLKALVLPACAMAVTTFPAYYRLLRRKMDDELNREEYVTFARIKGISTSRIISRHVARNSAVGTVTLVGLNTGLMIGHGVIIENIFAIPGLGVLLVQAVNQRDAPTVEGCVLVVGIIVVVLNLLSDLTYALFDPRMRAEL